jgi:hypothetical protein
MFNQNYCKSRHFTVKHRFDVIPLTLVNQVQINILPFVRIAFKM